MDIYVLISICRVENKINKNLGLIQFISIIRYFDHCDVKLCYHMKYLKMRNFCTERKC